MCVGTLSERRAPDKAAARPQALRPPLFVDVFSVFERARARERALWQ